MEHGRYSEVLEIAFDSVLDAPNGLTDPVRRLRFVGSSCAVEVDVRGVHSLAVDVRVQPLELVVIYPRTKGMPNQIDGRLSHGRRILSLSPGITSFVIRWPRTERQAVRTAWVVL